MNIITMNIISRLLLVFALIFSPLVHADSIGKKLFNTMQYKKAKDILTKLSHSGDADASFWLSLVQFRTGQSYEAGDTMLLAAEQGNPWAMRLMVPKWNGYCGYLGWPCDQKWREKAIAGWELLANKRDGKAMYALLKWGDQWWKSVPIYRNKKYRQLVKESVKNGGYQAVTFNSSFPISINEKLNLLSYAVGKKDVSSMVSLYLYCDEYKEKIHVSNCDDLLKTALNLGETRVSYALYQRYLGYYNGKSHFDSVNLEKAYYYYFIAKQLHVDNHDFSVVSMDFNLKQNDFLKNKYAELNREKIEDKARVILKKIKPSLFYDESFPYDVLLKP